MGRVIAILNQKGGVGKTTSSVNLSAALANKGKKVLAMDLDPQANMTTHFGINPHQIDRSVYHVLSGSRTLDEVTLRKTDRLNIVPANIDLSGAEIELVSSVGRETLLKDALAASGQKYDYVIIDCPPSLGLLTLNSLVAAKELFIPLQTEFFALQGMAKLLETVEVVKKRINRELEISGIIPCLYKSSRNLDREVLSKIQEYFGAKVFDTSIRENVALAEAPSHGKTIFEYAPDSNGAKDYASLAQEVISRE